MKEYRGFTIRAKLDKGYEVLHPKNGELRVCGWAPSVAEAKEVIDMRMKAATRAIDVLVGTENPQ